MTIQEAYISFLTKVNRNLKSNNVSADKARFVLLYNEEQIRRVDYILDNKNNDEIREIQEFLVSKSLSGIATDQDRYTADLPNDFLDLSSAYCLATTESCGKDRVSLNEIKDFDREEFVGDNNNKPSWEYREAPFYVGNNKINIFFEDFQVTDVYLSYYKYPTPVDIAGYIKDDGSASADQNPQGSERFINKVINMCAESFARNYADTNSITINKDRIITNT
tara:strand:+ start:262 stop:927 length:666 start_codon:yes stop_codon:yes gene_type:complete